MTARNSVCEALGRNSSLYNRYTAVATDALGENGDLRAAQAEWVRFVVDSHGDVFAGLKTENPRETLFIDSLYYDFVVDRLIAVLEGQYGFQVLNRGANANTGALSFEYQSLHEMVLDRGSLQGAFEDRVGPDDLHDFRPDLLRDLYERIIAPELRVQLGEYYTPRGLADLSVRELAVEHYDTETFLDPGCGSGIFLAAVIDAKREALGDDLDANSLLDCITNTVYGIDLNPVAVKSAKLSYLLAVRPLLAESIVDHLELPVFLTDSLGLTRDDEIRYGGEPLGLSVDHLVGNPPWITWGDLSDSLRDAWREQYADRLNLLPHHGLETRLGHGNDDISVPFVWVCLDQYLDDGGDASFVLKRDITKGPAGRLLRTQQVGSRSVAVRHIHDFNGLEPFGAGVDVRAAIYTLAADSAPSFPIETTSWTRQDETPAYTSVDRMEATLDRESTGLAPVDSDDPSSSWIRADAERRALGDCEHEIRHGIKDDAKAVFSIDREQLIDLEHDHIYPYIRSKHVVKYGLFGHALHLVPITKANEDNAAELQTNCPKTYEYLDSHRQTLEDRSSTWLDDGTFYNLFGVGPYTWSEYKIVWCRLGFKPHFAVTSTVGDDDLGEKLVVPGDHFMFISTDDREEAHFLCGLLNSSLYQRSIEGIASEGKSSLSKAVISRLELPAYEATEAERRLAELSMKAHEIVPEHTDTSKRAYNKKEIPELNAVQAEIDKVVERLISEHW